MFALYAHCAAGSSVAGPVDSYRLARPPQAPDVDEPRFRPAVVARDGIRPEEGAMLNEFKKFAVKGNVMDMAVGIIIGAAFGTIVKSLVADVIMPPIGLALGGVDFGNLFSVLQAGSPAGPYATLDAAREAGAVTVNWGLFINTIISFVIVALAVFMIVRSFNKLQTKEEEKPAAPPEPTKEEVLLAEIRDLLAAQGSARS
jgi:large conductance mechanosensitive channel